MFKSHFLLAGLALMLGTAAQAACFTVLDAKGEILSETSTPPVDMSRPLHETVEKRFGPGAVMMFGLAEPSCGPEAEPFDDSAAAAQKRQAPRQRRADRG